MLRLSGPIPPGGDRPEEIETHDEWLLVTIVAGLTSRTPRGDLGPAPRLVPSDFVPWRKTTDVLVRGTCDAGPVTLTVGDVERRFSTIVPAGKCDLASGLASADGIPFPLVPTPQPPKLQSGRRWFGEDHWDDYHAAPPALRFPWLRGDERIVLRTASGSLDITLPNVAPRLRVVGAMLGMPDQELLAGLEEVALDLDTSSARLVFRSLVPVTREDGRDVDRIDLLFVDLDEEDVLKTPLFDADVPRARFFRAHELEHVEKDLAPEPFTEQEETIRRYETWDGMSPLPVLEMAHAARIAAELAEQREPRPAVFTRHGLSAYDWDVEERAWAEGMARPPGPDEEGVLAERYAAEFAAAQDALARPEERAYTARHYAVVTAALEGPRPDRAFADAGMGLSAYQRLDRRMRRKAEADPAFARELDAELAKARGQVPDIEDGS